MQVNEWTLIKDCFAVAAEDIRGDLHMHTTFSDGSGMLEEMLEKAGNSDKYQLKMLVIFMSVFFFAAFIQMGFPIIFQPAHFDCPEG